MKLVVSGQWSVVSGQPVMCGLDPHGARAGSAPSEGALSSLC